MKKRRDRSNRPSQAKPKSEHKKLGRSVGAIVTDPRKTYLLQPETLKFVKNMTSMGHSQTKIAKIIGVNRNTLATWKRENESLRRALDEGKHVEFNEVMEKLGELAKSGKYPYLTQKYAEKLEDNIIRGAEEDDANANKKGKDNLGKISIHQLRAAVKKDVFTVIEEDVREIVVDAKDTTLEAQIIDQDVSLLEAPEVPIKDVTPLIDDPFIKVKK